MVSSDWSQNRRTLTAALQASCSKALSSPTPLLARKSQIKNFTLDDTQERRFNFQDLENTHLEQQLYLGNGFAIESLILREEGVCSVANYHQPSLFAMAPEIWLYG